MYAHAGSGPSPGYTTLVDDGAVRHADVTIGIKATTGTRSLLNSGSVVSTLTHPLPPSSAIICGVRWIPRGLRTLAALGVFATMLISAACGASNTSSGVFPWSTIDGAALPNGTNAEFLGVSCLTIRNCFAVGSRNAGGSPGAFQGGLELPAGDAPLVEHFNGTMWSISPSPTTGGALFGISCPSVSFCVAVGYQTGLGAHSLIELFDGKNWHIDPSPNDESLSHNTNRLWSVSCTSSIACTAVGSDLDDQSVNRLVIEEPVIDTFTGQAWSLVPLSSSIQVDLLSVSCKESFCLAVGSGPALPNGPEAESFDGASWIETVRPPDVFGGVSCPIARECLVTPFEGYADSPPLVHEFNGRWIEPKLQLPRSSLSLNGISCSSVRKCTVVGNSLPLGRVTSRRMAIGVVDSNTAHLVSLANEPNKMDSTLMGVSCVSGDRCVAVGTLGTITAPNPGPSKVLTVVER